MIELPCIKRSYTIINKTVEVAKTRELLGSVGPKNVDKYAAKG